MKKFFVGVKGYIRDDRGVLLIKHASGYWDIPGGRIDGEEDFKDTLAREISEEVIGAKLTRTIKLLKVYRLYKDIVDDTSLVLLCFLAEAKIPEKVILSDEHIEHRWVKLVSEIPEEINPDMRDILVELLISR